MSAPTERGACIGLGCSCQQWLPVAETLRDVWPGCQSCPHSKQAHRRLAVPKAAPAT